MSGNVVTSTVRHCRVGYGKRVFSPSVASSPSVVRLRKRVTRCMVSSERNKSNNSCSSRCVPSIRNRDKVGRRSKKYCRGKSSASVCKSLNSRVCLSQVCIVLASSLIAISSTNPVPRVERHLLFNKVLTSLKPIFCSKLFG